MDFNPHGSSPDRMESDIVTLLIESPSARVAIRDSSANGQTSLLRNVLDSSRVCRHFGKRRVFLSCHNASAAGILWSRLASCLGVETPDSDDTNVAITIVLDELAASSSTLIILDKLECLYSGIPVQQESTDVLLAVLAAVDEVALLVSFSGSSLPECVYWSLVDDHVRAPISVVADVSSPDSGRTELPSPSPPLAGGQTLPAICSATTTMEVGVMNTVAGIHDTERPPGPPTIASSRLLPPRPAVFHGRDKELERLVQQILVPNSAPLGIVGPGGIGKTTLALKVLHHPKTGESFSTCRFFVSCEDMTSPDDVLARLAYKIGANLPQGTPIWEAVLEKLRSNKQTFLVIDNFESIWSPTDKAMREAAEVFLAQLAVLDEVTILVTTRGNQLPEDFSWANAATAELDTLSSTAARQVFCDLTCLKPEVLATEPENSALTQLLKEVDFVPLAITLLSRLDDLPSRLLREWLEYFTEVLEADQHDGTQRELSVEVSIKISLAHLPPETTENRPRQLLAVCGQLPAGLFVELANHLRFSIPSIDEAAESLLRHSLVYAGSLGELRMLSPVRHNVSQNMPMDDMARFGVEAFYLRFGSRAPQLDRMAIDGPAFDREMPNALSILTSMADRPNKSLVRSVDLLVEYSILRGQRLPLSFPETVLLHVEDHPQWMASCLVSLGYLRHTSGDDETARRHFEMAAEQYLSIGDESGVAKSQLGLLLTATGESRESIQARWAQSDLRHICSDAGEASLVDFLETRWMEPSAAGVERLQSAREAHIKAGSLVAAIHISCRLAGDKKTLGDIAGAIQEYETTITLCEQGLPQLWELAAIKLNLAKLYLDRTDYTAAEDLLGEAYALFSARDNQWDLAETIQLTGRLRAGQRRYQEAEENCEEAARLFRGCGDIARADKCTDSAGEIRNFLLAVASLT